MLVDLLQSCLSAEIRSQAVPMVGSAPQGTLHCWDDIKAAGTTHHSSDHETKLKRQRLCLISLSNTIHISKNHNETANHYRTMVAGSSLRRPPKPTHQHSTKSINDDEQTSLALRSKRIRAVTITEQDHNHKRRRLSATRPQPLHIPLRGKAIFSQAQAQSDPSPATPSKPIESPLLTGLPQYDQIRKIEQKAIKAIQTNAVHPSKQDDQRKLRKHGGMRGNTELAQYFPNFEEMLSLDPPDPSEYTFSCVRPACLLRQDTLTGKTNIILIDDTPDYVSPLPRQDPFGSRKSLHKTTIIDLPVSASLKKGPAIDPMNEDIYLKVHRKHERHEKTMKNGDREKSQHEKYQLERLLDELRGPDWLKTLGVSGITDTEKKRYEPKRVLFVRETQKMIEKFIRYKEQEKRMRIEREQELREEAAEAEERELEGDSLRSISTQPPNSSEIDALASQQLLEEVKSASKRKKTVIQEVVIVPPVYKPFTSFFEKRHIRDAAVSGRQRGRTILAFGCPVPDLEEQEFSLPDDILTEDAIRVSQRSRRRKRRDIDE